jgi:hypothetical protein
MNLTDQLNQKTVNGKKSSKPQRIDSYEII